MRHAYQSLFAATLLALAGTASAGEIDVMTQNQYIGANITPLIEAVASGDPAVFNAALVNALHIVAENQTADRVNKLAEQISTRRPHLVGLQEVWNLDCEPTVVVTDNPCLNPYIAAAFGDHIALTEAVLGANYVREAVVQNFAAQVPFTLDGTNYAVVTVIDRDVIYARSDVAMATTHYPLCTASSPSGQGCNYTDYLYLGPVFPPVTRGYVAVESTINGTRYLFVNTHLEVEGIFNYGDPVPIQSSQAEELIGVLEDEASFDEMILVGDMNSDPNDPALGHSTPYTLFTEAGLNDMWLARPGRVAGLSCCQDETLSNRVSALTRRIDLVFTSGWPRVAKDVRVIGEVAADRLAPPGRGLWPSDHASVAAKIQY
jgi:endonuclease/exonuclease/phosphatase family metal-dependent hydrolase